MMFTNDLETILHTATHSACTKALLPGKSLSSIVINSSVPHNFYRVNLPI